jgi:hypothetical protein
MKKVYRIEFRSICGRVPEPLFVVASCATDATDTVQRFLDGRGLLGVVLHDPVEIGVAEGFEPGVIERDERQ